MTKQPEMFFCETHGYMHKKGSKTYDACISTYLDAKDEAEEEAEPVAKAFEKSPKATKTVLVEVEPDSEPEKPVEIEPVQVESGELYLSSFAKTGDNELICSLVKDAPDTITFKSAIYAGGQRVFRRNDEPFTVTETEYRTILNRGVVYFEIE